MIARGTQSHPRFTDLASLHTWCLAHPTSLRTWPLHNPGSAGTDSDEIGRWEYAGGVASHVGKIHVVNFDFNQGVVVNPGAAAATLAPGHGFTSGQTVRFWDTSAAAELGDRVVTVAGDILTWTGNIVGMAPGDQVFSTGNAFSIGGVTRQLRLSAGAILTPGLTLTSSGAAQASLSLMSYSAPVPVSHFRFNTRKTVTCTGGPTNNSHAFSGAGSYADGVCALGGVRRVGGVWVTSSYCGAMGGAGTIVDGGTGIALADAEGTTTVSTIAGAGLHFFASMLHGAAGVETAVDTQMLAGVLPNCDCIHAVVYGAGAGPDVMSSTVTCLRLAVVEP
jgi:hypothetical protein